MDRIAWLILIFLQCGAAAALARTASAAAPFPGRWRAGASYECLIPGRSSADRKRPKLVNCGPAYNTRQPWAALLENTAQHDGLLGFQLIATLLHKLVITG